MKIYKIPLLAVLLFALAACAVPGGQVTETDEPAGPAEPTDTPSGPVEPEYSVEWLEDLDPKAILLQLDYEPTFSREEVFHEFGRVPTFTLYADGTVIFERYDETTGFAQILTVQISPEETLALLRDVMDAGFMSLEDQLDFCQTDETGQEMCIADAAFTILRARLADGKLREVKTYANFSNEPGVFDEIVLIMSEFEHPDAGLYLPEKALLLVRALSGDFEIPVQEWPLSAERVPVPGEQLQPVFLDAGDVEAFVNGLGRNAGDFYFEVDGTAFSAYLVPWLPGEDHTDEVNETFPPATPAPVEEPFMIIEQKAVADLAGSLGISAEEISVTTFKEVTWPNGCLGIVYPDVACTEALVPGYQLFLEAGGETYEYRADREGKQVVPAAAGEDALPPIEDPEA